MFKKVTCTEYDLPTDMFCFETSYETVAGETNVEPFAFDGTTLVSLGDKKLSLCTENEIAAYLLYTRHFEEEPSDLLHKEVMY